MTSQKAVLQVHVRDGVSTDRGSSRGLRGVDSFKRFLRDGNDQQWRGSKRKSQIISAWSPGGQCDQ